MRNTKLEISGVFETNLTEEEIIEKLEEWLYVNKIEFIGECRDLETDIECTHEIIEITDTELEYGKTKNLDMVCKDCGELESGKWFAERIIQGLHRETILLCEICANNRGGDYR